MSILNTFLEGWVTGQKPSAHHTNMAPHKTCESKNGAFTTLCWISGSQPTSRINCILSSCQTPVTGINCTKLMYPESAGMAATSILDLMMNTFGAMRTLILPGTSPKKERVMPQCKTQKFIIISFRNRINTLKKHWSGSFYECKQKLARNSEWCMWVLRWQEMLGMPSCNFWLSPQQSLGLVQCRKFEMRTTKTITLGNKTYAKKSDVTSSGCHVWSELCPSS